MILNGGHLRMYLYLQSTKCHQIYAGAKNGRVLGNAGILEYESILLGWGYPEYPGYPGYLGYPAEVVTSMVSQLVLLDRLRCNFDREA